ncbi:MAG: hypothetical protein WDO17_26650 [Alphaproteobacteria bacterium]
MRLLAPPLPDPARLRTLAERLHALAERWGTEIEAQPRADFAKLRKALADFIESRAPGPNPNDHPALNERGRYSKRRREHARMLERE